MRKKRLLTLGFLLLSILIFPIATNALGLAQIGDCNALFGSTQDSNSVAWMIQLVLDIIKVAGPVLVAVLSSIEFVQVILKGDDDAMAKAQKKLITRLLLIVLLFLLPTLTEVLLDIFGLSTNSTCGIK